MRAIRIPVSSEQSGVAIIGASAVPVGKPTTASGGVPGGLEHDILAEVTANALADALSGANPQRKRSSNSPRHSATREASEGLAFRRARHLRELTAASTQSITSKSSSGLARTCGLS